MPLKTHMRTLICLVFVCVCVCTRVCVHIFSVHVRRILVKKRKCNESM